PGRTGPAPRRYSPSGSHQPAPRRWPVPPPPAAHAAAPSPQLASPAPHPPGPPPAPAPPSQPRAAPTPPPAPASQPSHVLVKPEFHQNMGGGTVLPAGACGSADTTRAPHPRGPRCIPQLYCSARSSPCTPRSTLGRVSRPILASRSATASSLARSPYFRAVTSAASISYRTWPSHWEPG